MRLSELEQAMRRIVGSEPGPLLAAVAGAEGVPAEFAAAAKSLGERQGALGGILRSVSKEWYG